MKNQLSLLNYEKPPTPEEYASYLINSLKVFCYFNENNSYYEYDENKGVCEKQGLGNCHLAFLRTILLELKSYASLFYVVKELKLLQKYFKYLKKENFYNEIQEFFDELTF